MTNLPQVIEPGKSGNIKSETKFIASQLTFQQVRFASFYFIARDIEDTCRMMGWVDKDTGNVEKRIYNGWSREAKENILKLTDLMALETIQTAQEIMERGLNEAVVTLLSLMHSEDENMQFKASKEVIEMVLGKAKAKGHSVNIYTNMKNFSIVSPDDWDTPDES